MAEVVTIIVDGRELEVPADELLIKAAEDNGNYIPRFCWHPRMKPVGMCRMCLVELETPQGRILTTACTTSVTDGMAVDTQSDTVRKAQEGVLEFLLINHPLDCPVCDRGGECPLQDQTLAYGPGESRFVEEKRHFEKPIPISELVMLDRERCILCARCTRFSDEVSGDPLIEFKDRGYGTQVQTFPDEPFSSYFSGNTVQICPVGALTATPYRFRARPWDLTAVESTCTHCTVGCRISVQSSQNEVLRFLGIDNDATNWGWLSDKCRFGFEFIGSEQRLTSPLVKDEDGMFREVSWSEALDRAEHGLRTVIDRHGAAAVAGIGGARGTNEDAYAFGKFLRVAVGTNHIDAQLDDGIDPRLLVAATPRATIADLDGADTILLWAGDLKEEIGTLYLRVRHSVLEEGTKLVVVHPRATGLDDIATHKLTYKPGQGIDLLRALEAEEESLAEAAELLAGGNVVALVGRVGVTEDPRLAESVAAYARHRLSAKLMPLARRSNVYGALDMGLSPSLLPGRASADSQEARAALAEQWGELPDAPGRDTRGILEALTTGDLRALVLNGADPVRDVPDGALGWAALNSADFVIALDLFLTDSSRLADVVLPARGFTEKEGTVTNLEGRVQKVNEIVPAPGQARPDWAIFDDLAQRLQRPIGLHSAEAISKEIEAIAPAYEGATWSRLEAPEGRDGLLLPLTGRQPLEFIPIIHDLPSRTHDFVLHSARTLYDDGVLMRMSLSLAKLAPGPMAFLHPDDAARIGVEPGQTVRVETTAGEVEMPADVDSSLLPGVVFVPFNQRGGGPLGSGLEAAVSVVG